MALSHGAGPCFFMEKEMLGMNKHSYARKMMENRYNEMVPEFKTCENILVVSAHWESKGAEEL